MPKRTDISSIAIIGAGPIVIGQACEFDYSGTQACKALKEEGYRLILINSNPATIMTDPGLADATYVEPITPEVVARILERERPDAVLPTMGGQTALNTAMALAEDGTLDRLGIELIGANREAIAKAEDRQLFRETMDAIGLESPKSSVVHSIAEALDALDQVGLPAIIRPSFTLGGTGGGIAYNRAEFLEIAGAGLRASRIGEVLIEESVLGWKEYEMEVVRDRADNCIIICSIENVDPMGVHTGDSITVAPALTLTDKEYQIMRNASIACLRAIGVDTGGSNVQFAVNPDNGRMVVIEMNPRVSRSSALASKATGFPIAKVAAKLAVGYTLDELQNDITRVTPASFEPTIDYVVTKIPRFAFEKFPGAEPYLSTAMKSVGEVMAIGRTFAESLQKALRSMETGLTGLDETPLKPPGKPAEGNGTGNGTSTVTDEVGLRSALWRATPDRLLRAAQALREGFTIEQVHSVTHFDPWFLREIQRIIEAEATLRQHGLPSAQEAPAWLHLKRLGFGDERLAAVTGQPVGRVRALREASGVRQVFKRIDTCAAEFASPTPYMYATYEGDGLNAPECEADPSPRDKVVILGGGPNRIGQGIEFDYCCVHAVMACREAGYETIMVNCNPETVSTDYDTADRLYFEPLTMENVLGIIEREREGGRVLGVIVQLGGQTPLKLAHGLEAAGVPILGTAPDAIDLAEDRERFQKLLEGLSLKQPPNGTARTFEQARAVAAAVGYPIVIRPSYVLGGRAMEIVHTEAGLERYMAQAVIVSGKHPVLIDGYLQDAVEVDVDALCDGADVYIAGIMEHIEEAGIHSGDSACALPPFSLTADIIEELKAQTRQLALALNVVGLINVQFAVKGSTVYLLEVNPRASRTVPFVAKATGVPVAKIAARLMTGEKLQDFDLKERQLGHTAIKEAVFPFSRFPGVDVILGPEMKSTGEVMGIDPDFGRAFAKSQLGAGVELPMGGRVFVSVRDRDKSAMVDLAARLHKLGFRLIATRGTAAHLSEHNIPVEPINKVAEGQPHIVDAMIDGTVQLVINTSEGQQSIQDSFSLRRSALVNSIPYYTTIAGARAAVAAIESLGEAEIEVAPLQSYLQGEY